MIDVGNNWQPFLDIEQNKDYYKELRKKLTAEYKGYKVYPPADEIFNSFKFTDFFDVKVVILGQDPYHGFGQANGLAFSVKDGVKPPPSVRNILKEVEDDVGETIIVGGNLEPWAKQGVFLLNTCLTVREGEPLSHNGIGWEIFTDSIISAIDRKAEPVVFMLWGNNARKKKDFLKNPKHLILESAHPSPLSAKNFFGCKHFSKANDYLRKNGEKEIVW